MDDPELIQEEKQAKEEGQKIIAKIKSLTNKEIKQLIKDGKIEKDEKDKVLASIANSDCGIRIDKTLNEDIQRSYLSREAVNRIQKLR